MFFFLSIPLEGKPHEGRNRVLIVVYYIADAV